MGIILDTCAFLAITGYGDKQLSSQAISRLENEAVFVSSISAFEIGIKAKKGKLLLGDSCPMGLYHRIKTEYFIEELPLSGDLLFKSIGLDHFHADPFDRMILAEALNRSLDVATWDSCFIHYLSSSKSTINIVN
jgi:PIN domain nuclease of toxin-antitoxin system